MKITQLEKSAAKRKFLEEAAKRFSEFGYEDTSIDEIALGAGYAKGTIYNYFKSKEELFAEVISEAAEHAVERYHSAKTHPTARESLRELALADLSVLKEEEPFMKVLAAEAMNPRSDRYGFILTHLGSFIELISNILEDGVQKGEVRSDKPVSQLALLFLGLLTLLYIQHWKSGGNWPSLEEIPGLVITIFMDGASATDTSQGKEA